MSRICELIGTRWNHERVQYLKAYCGKFDQNELAFNQWIQDRKKEYPEYFEADSHWNERERLFKLVQEKK